MPRSRTPARPLVALAVASATFSLAALLLVYLASRGTIVPTPRILVVLVLGFAAVLLGLGLRVRAFVRGRRSMEPIAAARVAALAVTGYYIAAAGVGVGAAYLVAMAGRLTAPAARADAWAAAATLGAGLLLFLVAVLVLRWCATPLDDQPEDDERGSRA